MKRQEEEKLIDLAYGELSESEASQLEDALQLDSRAAARVDDYRRLKSDLALLNRIPEPQISKERIREAILRRGLKDKSGRLAWAYALAPSLAAVIGLGLYLNQSTPPSPVSVTSKSAAQSKAQDPPSVASFTAPLESDIFHPDTELTDMGSAVRTDYTFGAAPLAAPVRNARFHTQDRREFNHAQPISDKDMYAEQILDLSELGAETSPQNLNGLSTGGTNSASPGSLTIPRASGSPSVDPKIVIVHDAQDRATGAQQATEDDTTANVLVSG